MLYKVGDIENAIGPIQGSKEPSKACAHHVLAFQMFQVYLSSMTGPHAVHSRPSGSLVGPASVLNILKFKPPPPPPR